MTSVLGLIVCLQNSIFNNNLNYNTNKKFLKIDSKAITVLRFKDKYIHMFQLNTLIQYISFETLVSASSNKLEQTQ